MKQIKEYILYYYNTASIYNVLTGSWFFKERRDLNMGEEKKMKTILVVDNEPDIQESVKNILEKQGYKVLMADDGKRESAHL